ncbi:hypothetical protein [Sphingomonas elodea]|uniref:hypothetical protein n=1 Tax=Sphingomonas elodea TaxID=179878 RepID=UPI000263053F|nr:hypothetical protein [Sphingomonas elodea]
MSPKLEFQPTANDALAKAIILPLHKRSHLDDPMDVRRGMRLPGPRPVLDHEEEPRHKSVSTAEGTFDPITDEALYAITSRANLLKQFIMQ